MKQLRKYDDDLTGWWTPSEKIKIHDIVALVPLNRAVQFSDRVERIQKDQKWQFERNVAVIGFFKSSGVRDFLTLKKEKGDLHSKDISDRLRESKSIAYDLLLSLYGDRKFIDSDPPLVYLLQILWDDLFLRYAAAVPKDEENNWFPLNVLCKTLRGMFNNILGSQAQVFGVRKFHVLNQSEKHSMH